MESFKESGSSSFCGFVLSWIPTVLFVQTRCTAFEERSVLPGFREACFRLSLGTVIMAPAHIPLGRTQSLGHCLHCLSVWSTLAVFFHHVYYILHEAQLKCHSVKPLLILLRSKEWLSSLYILLLCCFSCHLYNTYHESDQLSQLSQDWEVPSVLDIHCLFVFSSSSILFLECICLFFFFLFFKLQYSWFTMSCQSLLYSRVTQLYAYIHPFLKNILSIMVYHRILNIVPCAVP